MEIKIGIVGAGCAGLACGYELVKRGYGQITILEKEKVVGGRTVSEIHEGHRINLGAVWITPSIDKTYIKYLKEFDLMGEIDGPSMASKKLALIYKDRLMNLSRFSIVTSGVFSCSDIIKLGKLKKYIQRINFSCDYFDQEQERNHQISTADFFRERGFSEDFIERFVQPFTSMCYTPSDELSAAYGLRLLATGFLENKKPKNGMDVIARTLHKKLGNKIVTEAKVIKITKEENGKYTIEYLKDDSRDSINVDVVVLALPTFISNQLLPDLKLSFDYGNGNHLIVKGRLKEKYRKFLGIIIARAENPGNVYFIYTGEEDPMVSYVHLYEKDCDLTSYYEDYEIIKEVYKYPAVAAPRPGISIPDLKTKMENVYICGDFYRYPCVEAALLSGIRVADLIYCKYPTRGYTRL